MNATGTIEQYILNKYKKTVETDSILKNLFAMVFSHYT